MSPAMAARLTETLWDIGDIVKLIEVGSGTMTPVIALSVCAVAAIVPAYFVGRKARGFGRFPLAWLAGFACEMIAIIGIFFFAVSTNVEAAPLAVAMALAPPFWILLGLPALGLGAALLAMCFRPQP
jgi:hypothetical protein